MHEPLPLLDRRVVGLYYTGEDPAAVSIPSDEPAPLRGNPDLLFTDM